jgi:hypothetical protein
MNRDGQVAEHMRKGSRAWGARVNLADYCPRIIDRYKRHTSIQCLLEETTDVLAGYFVRRPRQAPTRGAGVLIQRNDSSDVGCGGPANRGLSLH